MNMAVEDTDIAAGDDQLDPVDGGGGSTRSLGLARWVQFGFLLAGLALFWVIERLATAVWGLFAEPNPLAVSAGAALVALVSVVALYKRRSTRELAYEVAGELAKVSWPSRKETWASTIVVIVTSLVAAGFLGVFDALWSALTDLIYKV
jgi:preprotein translocase subunit SecE